MATAKTFSVAGVSTLEGKTKIRFANDSMRIKILAKNGHTDVELIDLPREMTKGEIAQHMSEIGFGSGKPAVLAAIKDLAKKNPVGKTASTPAVQAETVTA
jgi:ribosome maturation protein Sdo1